LSLTTSFTFISHYHHVFHPHHLVIIFTVKYWKLVFTFFYIFFSFYFNLFDKKLALNTLLCFSFLHLKRFDKLNQKRRKIFMFLHAWLFHVLIETLFLVLSLNKNGEQTCFLNFFKVGSKSEFGFSSQLNGFLPPNSFCLSSIHISRRLAKTRAFWRSGERNLNNFEGKPDPLCSPLRFCASSKIFLLCYNHMCTWTSKSWQIGFFDDAMFWFLSLR
jgi:hypothetical protein